MSDPVHYCAWAQQPDIQIFCDEACTTPDVGAPLRKPPIFVTEEKPPRLYTFHTVFVTCAACLEKMRSEHAAGRLWLPRDTDV